MVPVARLVLRRESVFIVVTMAGLVVCGNWRDGVDTHRDVTTDPERPVDRLARQVQTLLKGEAPQSIPAQERVAGAVRSILGRSMAQIGEERTSRRVSPSGPSTNVETWTNPLELGAAYESLLMLRPRIVGNELRLAAPTKAGGHERKKRGAYYSPAWLVGLVLDAALDPIFARMSESRLLDFRVLDPSCGSGHFLVAAAGRIAARLATIRGKDAADERDRVDACRCVVGMDTDPVAVDVCRAAIWMMGGDETTSQIIMADGLLDAPPGTQGSDERSVDVVVGNPPFLNRLERRTAVTGGKAAGLKEVFGDAARAYTDLSALFLLRAVRLVRNGGRVAMIQPQSLLSSRDAEGVRAELMRSTVLESLWVADEHHFDASVFVCVPTFHKSGLAQGPVRRLMGTARRPLGPVAVGTSGAGLSWGALGSGDVPDVSLADISAGQDKALTIGDLAEVTADFRDEYYGLRGLVVEDESLGSLDRDLYPPLITTGLIDPARCLWGRVACRFDGRRWEAPRVDLARLRTTTDLSRWADSRLRCKLLLATQTRVLEAAVDEAGRWLPVTPLISIVPRLPEDVWRIGAALSSPFITALAARLSAGTALTRDAIKLSASQVRALPMPPDNELSRRAAAIFKEVCRDDATGQDQRLASAGRESCHSYGLGAEKVDELVRWWTSRRTRMNTNLSTDPANPLRNAIPQRGTAFLVSQAQPLA